MGTLHKTTRHIGPGFKSTQCGLLLRSSCFGLLWSWLSSRILEVLVSSPSVTRLSGFRRRKNANDWRTRTQSLGILTADALSVAELGLLSTLFHGIHTGAGCTTRTILTSQSFTCQLLQHRHFTTKTT